MKKKKDDSIQKFGGDWTEQKLENVRKYLVAYSTIMSKQKFSFAYVDAFAGTGYRELKNKNNESDDMLYDVLTEEEPRKFLEGSAAIALKVLPTFNRYIFIEKDEKRFKELESLKASFPDRANDIILKNTDANSFLDGFCASNWTRHRAVMFLDPYGMQVKWETIKAIAETEAIDLWILFPLGSGVSRLLRRDGKIEDTWKKKLTDLFGEPDWYDAFYEQSPQGNLFGEQTIEKTADFKTISDYFVKRLETIFPHVAKNPLPLYNSKKVPLFLLCFAAGNKKGGATAIKIAQDILGRS